MELEKKRTYLTYNAIFIEFCTKLTHSNQINVTIIFQKTQT